jgi:hypothetical protein
MSLGTKPKKDAAMDHDTKLTELMKQVDAQMEEFERMVPQLRALGDAHISIPFETLEEICRPVTTFAPPTPAFALRA